MAWQAKALMQNMVFHTFCPSIEAGGMADGLTKVALEPRDWRTRRVISVLRESPPATGLTLSGAHFAPTGC